LLRLNAQHAERRLDRHEVGHHPSLNARQMPGGIRMELFVELLRNQVGGNVVRAMTYRVAPNGLRHLGIERSGEEEQMLYLSHGPRARATLSRRERALPLTLPGLRPSVFSVPRHPGTGI
jgi:hypothetical protein